MNHPNNAIEDLSIALPITKKGRLLAQQFAQQQSTPEKAEQVRLNTLAVWVVNNYLEIMDIPTDLKDSDSWNPVVRTCSDVADLEVTGVGRLECRPIKAGEDTCHIPLEVWKERIGCIVVRVDDEHREANLLGFVPRAEVEELPISQLQPLEDLCDRVEELKSLVKLRQWLENIFEADWQPASELLTSKFRFRGDTSKLSVVERGKLIDLGVQLARHPVALIVSVVPQDDDDDKIGILLQVHPMGEQMYLPRNLQLIVLDESGAKFLEATARGADNYIQLELRGLPGERFSVKVAFRDASITEKFTI